MASIVNAPALAVAMFDRDIMERTVRISNRSFTTLPDVCQLLTNTGIPPEAVSALQKGRNDGEGVTLVLKRAEDIETLRSVDFHIVNNRKLYVTSIDKQTIFLRMHWLPVYATDACVRFIMADYGKVLSVEGAVSYHGKNNVHISTGVKIVKMEVSEFERLAIPHIIRFQCGNSVLLTGGGRPPLCLKCNKVGHMRRDCPTKMGHGSYADAASTNITHKLQSHTPTTPTIRISDTTETAPTPSEDEMEERVLIIDEREDTGTEEQTEENMRTENTEDKTGTEDKTESRGRKRSQVTDSFITVSPPQKSQKKHSKPSSSSSVETSNAFAALAEDEMSLGEVPPLDSANGIGDYP